MTTDRQGTYRQTAVYADRPHDATLPQVALGAVPSAAPGAAGPVAREDGPGGRELAGGGGVVGGARGGPPVSRIPPA